MSNDIQDIRLEAVRDGLTVYARGKGMELEEDGFETVFVDFLADTLHLFNAETLTDEMPLSMRYFHALVEQAKNHFHAEI